MKQRAKWSIEARIRAICDPLIAEGATPEDMRPITRKFLGIEIGRGGGGGR